MSTQKLPLLIPAGLPPLPPVPDGYDMWKAKGWAWKAGVQSDPWTHYQSSVPREGWLFSGRLTCNMADGAPAGIHDGFYILAVKATAKLTKPRRESLKMRFATAIQTGKRNEAMSALDIAEDCMRILQNHQRAANEADRGFHL